MAFLDNAGDVLCDVILTDVGRMRLAKGDGSFKIVKFALCDDEIDYSLYNSAHPSGSAYYDLEILQTPILEAFTNNMSGMKCKLITIPRTNLLYLPVLAINERLSQWERASNGTFWVASDLDTETELAGTSGVIHGTEPENGGYVRVDQGLMTLSPSYKQSLDADLVETQYIIEMDHRLGFLAAAGKSKDAVTKLAKVSYIDDDNVASYYLSLGNDSEFVRKNMNNTNANNEVITGPRGTIFEFAIQTSTSLQTSDNTYWFDRLGSTVVISTVTYFYIDSIVRITGATTGRSIDIPVRYLKKQ